MCSLLLVLRVSLLAVLMPLCWSPWKGWKAEELACGSAYLYTGLYYFCARRYYCGG